MKKYNTLIISVFENLHGLYICQYKDQALCFQSEAVWLYKLNKTAANLVQDGVILILSLEDIFFIYC